MTPPRITVVPPCRNAAAFLEATIRSVLEQEYPHLEYFVVDGGSTDGSREIVARHADRLAWWVSEPDRGQSEAINKGWRRATGELLAWLNADDLYLPGALHAVGELASRDPDTDIFHGRCLEIDCEGRVLGETPHNGPFSLEAHVLRQVLLPQPACFVRRRVIERIGLLREDLAYAMDYEYWRRAALAGCRFRFADQPWAAFRLHAGAKTHELSRAWLDEGVRLFREELRDPRFPRIPGYAGFKKRRIDVLRARVAAREGRPIESLALRVRALLRGAAQGARRRP